MKKTSVIVLVSIFLIPLASCKKNVEERELRKKVDQLSQTVSKLNAQLIDTERKLLASEQRLQKLPQQVKQKLGAFLVDKHPGIWDCGCNAMCIELKTEIKPATVSQIIKALNMNLILKSINGNTVSIKQDKAEWPVNMGSTGARCILARVVFSLTSVQGIEYVDFEFDLGDHAAPGRYSRIDFIDLWPLFD